MKTEYKTSINKRLNAIKYYYKNKDDILLKNKLNKESISVYYKDYYQKNKQLINNKRKGIYVYKINSKEKKPIIEDAIPKKKKVMIIPNKNGLLIFD